MALQRGLLQGQTAQSKVNTGIFSLSTKSLVTLFALLGLLLLVLGYAAGSWLNVCWPLSAALIRRGSLVPLGFGLILVLCASPIPRRAMPSIFFVGWLILCELVKEEADYRLPAVIIGASASILVLSLSSISWVSGFIRSIPALVCASSLFAALAILDLELQSGGLLGRLGYRLNTELVSVGGTTTSDGMLVNPNEIALPIALSAVALFSQDLRANGRTVRWGRQLLVAGSVVMLVLTQSRGMLLAFAMGFVAACLFGAWRWAWSLVTFLISGVLVACLALGINPISLDLLDRFGAQDSTLSTFGDRHDIWESSLERCIQQPIFGQSGVSGDVRATQFSPHNALLSSAELGGLFAFMLLLWIYLQPLVVSARYDLVSIGTAVALIVSSMSMDTLARPIFWITYAFLLIEINHVRLKSQPCCDRNLP